MLQVLIDDRLVMELPNLATRQARRLGVDHMVSGILSACEGAVQ